MKASLAPHRSSVYRYLSLAFADPQAAQLAELRREVAGLESDLRTLGDAVALAQARAWRTLLPRLRPRRWLAAHVQCFGHAISKECPPYAAEYDQANLFQKTQTLADIAGFYRAFGLQTAPALHERADHVSVELEFMHFLCLKEAHAAERGEASDRAAQCRAAQAKFLGQHLATWTRGFAQRLAVVAGEGPYRSLALLLEAFVAAEAARLEVPEGGGGRLNEAPEASDGACAARCGAPAAAGGSEVNHACI
ncbi:MAG: molecular chaperone TorD family protein [Burkholderiales bacterium]|nr:molecular chaperone TorD family protein [Burkholderiales bacterium]